ncbi:DsbA family protein [Desulfonatronovibrio hydrogenovorans]|uniref:DsbA family protein n=1 Tax=Desulfonatronovibrio hydrogenovorans TaxID=53245 RepID=UPI0004920BFB|nr:thioredoxin domain-containing protein [Desulfonatronovibrio hydrogenovorans]
MKKILFFAFCIILGLGSKLNAGLQEDVLITNVLDRFQGIIVERGGDPEAISVKNMTLERKIRFELVVSGQVLPLYAVRMALFEPETGRKQLVDLIVDETGTVQLDGSFVDLGTGESLHQDALDELDRIEGDPGVGDLLFKGSGTAQVLFLSDPFCPYCRHAYTHLLDQKDWIDEFRIAHFPIDPDSGSMALTLLMMEYKDEDLYQDVVDFAYMMDRDQIIGNPDLDVISLFNQQFNVFTDSPEEVLFLLQTRHQDELARQMKIMRDMGLTGTPVVIINGMRINGFNRDRMERLLKQN